ncbi:Uncharacterised protein [Serratia ficaria]|nr:Uncharacterised protein [Serratia ficaria]
MVGPRIIRITAVSSPSQPPIMAPRVVRRDQYIDRMIIGKLQLAAMENASPTIKAMFCFSNKIPSAIATMPSSTTVILDTRSSSRSVALPFLTTLAYRS